MQLINLQSTAQLKIRHNAKEISQKKKKNKNKKLRILHRKSTEKKKI